MIANAVVAEHGFSHGNADLAALIEKALNRVHEYGVLEGMQLSTEVVEDLSDAEFSILNRIEKKVAVTISGLLDRAVERRKLDFKKGITIQRPRRRL
tara:strand:- start:243 stop:533 length:291 start_codon:yes stop_codon:yes gene_type:complete